VKVGDATLWGRIRRTATEEAECIRLGHAPDPEVTVAEQRDELVTNTVWFLIVPGAVFLLIGLALGIALVVDHQQDRRKRGGRPRSRPSVPTRGSKTQI
jgi:hypothetical protein